MIYGISALLIGAGIGGMYLLLRGGSSRPPRGALAWSGVMLSLLVVLFGGGLSLMAFTGALRASGAEEQAVIGRPAPPLTFRLVASNEKRALSDYEGKVVLLNLWATWCPPCLDELPQLNRLQETYGPEGLVVVTISDERRATIQRFEREQLPLKTVSGYLPDSLKWPFPYDRVLQSRPTSFVIDRQGIIRNTWPGAKNFAFFERAVWPYLAQGAPPEGRDPTTGPIK